MKVLVISAEVWRDETNGGNVLSNIFNGLDAEFAQIYCNPGQPHNHFCKKYYQMTDVSVLKNLLKKEPVGKSFVLEKQQADSQTKIQMKNIKGYRFLKTVHFQLFYLLQEFMWLASDWKSKELNQFIKDFAPDVIFAPCYASQRMLALTRYVKQQLGKPVISYISDDNYSLRQFHISPVYWLNRVWLRREMRRTFPDYKLVYTMTEEQKKECEVAFGANMKILRKFGTAKKNLPQNPQHPITLIYAGGIYIGRANVLCKIVQALNQINRNGVKMQLHIYTGNDMTKKQEKILNDQKNSFVHGIVSTEELKKKYEQSDIALHVESFRLKHRLQTRLSFSTKIVDCLESGCALIAIAWKEHSGLKYLQRENAAICVDNLRQVLPIFSEIAEKPELIYEWRKKARKCFVKNHDGRTASQELYQDFAEIMSEGVRYENRTD